MEAGGDGASDAANILKHALARGEFGCIGATTIAEYRKYIEKDPAFERRFQVVWVDEPTREEAVEILLGLRSRLEKHHDVQITEEAIRAAVELSQRYLVDFYLPDKGIDLIDHACAAARLVSFTPRKQQAAISIHRREIAEVVAKRCRIPAERLTEDETERLLKIEDHLCKRVIGQDDAIQTVAEAIRTARAGLNHPTDR